MMYKDCLSKLKNKLLDFLVPSEHSTVHHVMHLARALIGTIRTQESCHTLEGSCSISTLFRGNQR